MSPRITRTALLAAAALVGCLVLPASTGVGAAVAEPARPAVAGTVSPDGRWLVLTGGAELSLRPMAFADCLSGWACLWQNATYSGAMVKLTSPNTSITNLASVGFDDEMTSWANRSSYDARWFYNTNLTGTTRCMNPGNSTTNVGATDNDQASSFKLYTDAAACT